MKEYTKHINSIHCDLCASSKNKLIFQIPELICNPKPNRPRRLFSILKCDKCGLVFTNLREIEQTQEFSYADELVETGLNEKIEFLLYSLFYKLTRIIPKTRNGKALDVGCGIGMYLQVLKKNNWKVYGVDTNLLAVKLAKEKFGLDIVNTDLIKTSFPTEYFDLVTFWHSFEHMPNPTRIIKEVYRILKKNGRLMIAVPNFTSIEAQIFRERFAFLGVPFHLYHFTPRTLRMILETNGFIVEKEVHDYLTPSIFTWSVLGLLENKLGQITNIKMKKLVSVVLYPLFLPISFVSALLKQGTFMTFSARKSEP